MKGRWLFPSNVVFVLFPRLQNEGWLNRKLSGAESAITHPRRWLTHQCVVHTWYGGGTSPETITEGPRESCLWSQAPHQPTGEQIQAIKFSYHPVPSGLQKRGQPQTVWKDELGSGQCRFTHSLSCFYALVQSQSEMWKAWKRVTRVVGKWENLWPDDREPSKLGAISVRWSHFS